MAQILDPQPSRAEQKPTLTTDTVAPEPTIAPAQGRALPKPYRVRYDAVPGAISLACANVNVYGLLRPHRFGLELTIRFTHDKTDVKRCVIPGEVPFKRAVEFLKHAIKSDITYEKQHREDCPLFAWTGPDSPERDIEDVLENSAIWNSRGRMDPQRKIPNAFFTEYPVAELARGRHTSIQAWWKDHLVQHASFSYKLGLETYTYPRSPEQQRTDAIMEKQDQDFWKQKRDAFTDITFNGGSDLALPKRPKALARYRRQRKQQHNFGLYVETRRNINALITLGLVPESPTSVRRFDKISLVDLRVYIDDDVHRSPAFGRFTSGVAQTFGKTLGIHGWLQARGSNAPLFTKIVAQLEHLPKSKRAATVLNQAINAGVSREAFCAIKDISLTNVVALTTLLTERQKLAGRGTAASINRNYKPPAIPLADGWNFADHTTFPQLSDKYSCCISNSSFYEAAVAQGRAHVLYREDHKTKNGAVAFLTLQASPENAPDNPSRQWIVEEIRGFGNSNVDPEYMREATIVAKVLTKTLGGPSPAVPQLSDVDAKDELHKIDDAIEAIAPGSREDEWVRHATSLKQEAHELRARQLTSARSHKRGR
jgi:hypothetical protein